MRLIDADDLRAKWIHNGINEKIYDTNDFLDSIDSADTVDPVNHGFWIGEGDGYADGELVYDVWQCSECGHYNDDGIDRIEDLPKYCPNCGAKMDYSTDD